MRIRGWTLNFHVVLENKDAHIRKVIRENGKTVLTAGAGSYVLGGNFTADDDDVHVLIGRYSAVSDDVAFIFQNENECKTAHASIVPHSADKWTDRHSGRQIIIGNDVRIGGKATILGGVRIGNGAVVEAGAVVTEDVPPYAVMAGNPAHVLRHRFDEQIAAALERIKWWNWPEAKIRAHIHMLCGDMAKFIHKFSAAQNDTPAAANETALPLRMLKEQGCRIYYFVPDFSSTEAIWRKVFRDYLRSYTAEDPAALCLELGRKAPPAALGELNELLSALGEKAPLVLTHESGRDFSVRALQQADVLITTKEDVSSRCADYAAAAGAEIVYGGDEQSRIFHVWKEYNISIGILTYQPDYEKLLMTLTSVIRQQGCSYEIVIGDDGSKDFRERELELWLLQHGCRDYVIVRSPENKGTVHNVMNVLTAARGHYVKLISPGDYLYNDHVLADMLRFMEENSYKIAFGRACYYSKMGDKYHLINRMNPFQLRPYRERDFSAVKEAYLVYQDYVVGAAFMGERSLLAAYTRDILGQIIYTEDAVYPIMIADDIRLGFWDENFVWYEYNTGISGDLSQEWRERLLYDSKRTLAIIAERHSEILDIIFGSDGGKQHDDAAYRRKRAAYYAEAERMLAAGSYLQNVDPAELSKLVHAEVVT